MQTQPGPLRWPIMPTMTTTPVTGSVAMLLAAPDFIAERGLRDVAWLQGMGWATEPSFLGDRDLTSAPALAAAARQAYAAAGITDPASAFDLAEVTDATPYAELLAYEALSLCPREAWQAQATNGSFARGGRVPVNLSGGVLTWNPVFCTGLIRIAEVANQIRGRAGAHQLPNVRRGLAHAGSGFAMQYQAAVVLGREARA
jgi:acetyl-CoA C-acetyltransferase